MIASKKTPNKAKQITDETFNLIKFFIASDTTMAQLNSPYLRGCLHPDVNINNPFTFRYKILPSICKLLYEAIEEKLNSCY